MGGTLIGELTNEWAEVYASKDIKEILTDDPEFFSIWGPSELGRVAIAAFNNSNQSLLDAISQHAFDKVMDYIKEPDFVGRYAELYRQSEDYVETLANRGDL